MKKELSTASMVYIILFLPALCVENSKLLLAGVTSNVALNIAVTVAL